MNQPKNSTATRSVASRLQVIEQRRPAVQPPRRTPRTNGHSAPHHDRAKRPVAPADAAQARVFERMLHAELVRLQPRETAPTGSNASVRELHGLLEALQDRFGAPTERQVVSPRFPAPGSRGPIYGRRQHTAVLASSSLN